MSLSWIDMNFSARKSQFKFLPFLVTLLITNSVLLHLFEQKTLWSDTIPLGHFFSPITFVINDIIAEIYGYKLCMRVFWSMFLCRLAFTSLCTFFVDFPSNLVNDFNGYNSIFFLAWYSTIVNPITFLIAWNINARIIIQWKILLKGRYFWLRSLGSSGIAEIFFAILSFSIYHYQMTELNHSLKILFWLIVFRLFFSAIFAFPASIIVNFIKLAEGIDEFKKTDFNPFKKNHSNLKAPPL